MPRARWFQLYVWKDRAAAEDLMARAAASGYEALVLTVDAPVAGARLRDARNGLSDPADAHGQDRPRHGPPPGLVDQPADHRAAGLRRPDRLGGTVADLLNVLFDPTMTIADLDWIRAQVAGPLVVKGIQTVDDAKAVIDAGADAIVLSNHGGRQLDRAPVPLRVLPDAPRWSARTARSGPTPASCPARTSSRPSRSTRPLDGRPRLPLRPDGRAAKRRGARRRHPGAEIRRTMALLGVATIAELRPELVRLPPPA